MKVKDGSGPKLTPRIIEVLHQFFLVTESKRPLQPDPFYERNAVLTPEVVASVIVAMEELFVRELKSYPSYHRNAQGISQSEYLVPPGFDKLDFSQQLAVVQGVDKIFQEYREEPKPEPQPEDPKPEDLPNEPGPLPEEPASPPPLADFYY